MGSSEKTGPQRRSSAKRSSKAKGSELKISKKFSSAERSFLLGTILTKNQQALLKALSEEKIIQDSFFLSGGTALSEYYLHHRFSEDLDFFCEEEFDPQEISTMLKKLQKKLPIGKIDYQQSFHRNLFFLHLDDEVIKTEFTYYPFPRIEPSQKKKTLKIDSLLDIAVNKVHTVSQNPRSRDFIDLYFILHQKKWKLAELIKQAQIKFDSYIDPLQFGAQLMLVTSVKDYPRMIKKLDSSVWQKFFLNEAKKLEAKVLQ